MSRSGWAGLAALGLAWSAVPGLVLGGPFSAHMLRHLLLVAVAAPLLALALAHRRPGWGQRIARVCSPLAASALEFLVVWGWHAPALHRATRTGTLSLVLEQSLYLGSGLLLWITALARPLAGIVALLLTAAHMTLLGVLLALSSRQLFASGPITHDQELGGVLMLAIGGAANLAGGLVLLARLLKPSPAAGR
jgi:putative membrane protein